MAILPILYICEKPEWMNVGKSSRKLNREKKKVSQNIRIKNRVMLAITCTHKETHFSSVFAKVPGELQTGVPC